MFIPFREHAAVGRRELGRVFVDEFNASLEGSPVYGAFLSPIEDGVYLRRGNAFRLQPCVWIFAGTGMVDDSNPLHSEKLNDIRSRMTMIKNIGYKSLREQSRDQARVDSEAQLEHVYLSGMIMHKPCSDVQMVSYEVLERFSKEDPAQSPARRISNKVAALRNVQYGQVTRKNCGAWENVEWPKDRNERMVRLVLE